MAQSTGATPSNTSAPTDSTSDPLAAAQSALTAVGEQYATSQNLSYEARQDLVDQVFDAVADLQQALANEETGR